MKTKVFKTILIIGIILISFTCLAFATEQTDEENSAVTSENTVSAEDTLDNVATVTSVTSLSNLPEANLGLNNILNILLLAVGFLLILFAIAILIRLKK